jgi:chromosome segregation ATPase
MRDMEGLTAMTPGKQMQHPDVQIALTEIRTFAGQMQQMVALFARGHADMARQLEATTLRLDKAVESVAMGEARIAAQIASFERMTNDARRATEDHERSMRHVIERFQQTAAELANESVAPLKAQVDGVSRHLAEAHARILSATTGFSHTLETAVGVVDANARKIMVQQADIMASRVVEAMQGGETRLASVSEALDHAAGALAHRLWATAEAQDNRNRTVEALNAKLESLTAVLPGHEITMPKPAQEQEPFRLYDATNTGADSAPVGNGHTSAPVLEKRAA